MNVIDIFEENHRFSQKAPHPGPHRFVNAANLTASNRAAVAGAVVVTVESHQ